MVHWKRAGTSTQLCGAGGTDVDLVVLYVSNDPAGRE
jgi:hypothetical protein